MEDSTKCEDGCNRFTAMEECELEGGFLLDDVGSDVLSDVLERVSAMSESIKHSFWWTGASDFRFKNQQIRILISNRQYFQFQ